MTGHVTFSFDDGDDLDLAVADELSAHGLVGTFYLASKRLGTRVSWSTVHELANRGMEIGSHTHGHHSIRRIRPAEFAADARSSKQIIEDGLGAPISSFCFPYGHFKRSQRDVMANMGWTTCRTTQAFSTSATFDPMFMPVSLALFEHSTYRHLRHAVREANVRVLPWLSQLGPNLSTPRLIDVMIADVAVNGGLVHFWGHAAELERTGQWRLFQRAAAAAADAGLTPVTNGQAGRLAAGAVTVGSA
jgi:peptidoglycan/xylan/chitin deacetylase (PgdA/CDA1 family)